MLIRWHTTLLLILLALYSHLSAAQIRRADLGLSGTCRAQDAAVLPAGYHRLATEPYSSLTVNGKPHKPAKSLSKCQYVSFSEQFDRLLGKEPQLWELGGLKPYNWAFEGLAWLPGVVLDMQS